jgi:cytochrome c oxidase subunit 4
MTHDHGEEHHLVSYSTYIMVWLALLAFTGLTVTVAGFNLRQVSVFVALLVATCKTFLVLNYFMHLKYEQSIFKIMIFVTVLILAVFIVLTFFDVSFR